jgi:methionine sulfoxide reductase catalytic subunit
LLSKWLPPRRGWCLRSGLADVGSTCCGPCRLEGVALAQGLRELPAVQDFIARYPGAPPSAPMTDGFPAWLRVQHFLNILFMAFIVRSGIQILADHPRLYWQRDCTPGTDWFRFQKAVPVGRIRTAKEIP